jgi:hypothetical protein
MTAWRHANALQSKNVVIASEAMQSRAVDTTLDCRVAFGSSQ